MHWIRHLRVFQEPARRTATAPAVFFLNVLKQRVPEFPMGLWREDADLLVGRERRHVFDDIAEPLGDFLIRAVLKVGTQSVLPLPHLLPRHELKQH
jgi:hypothetical protein